MPNIVDIKTGMASGYSKKDKDGMTLYLSGGGYGDGDIHYNVIVHLNPKQLAALLTEQFYYPMVTIEVSDERVTLTA